MSDPMSAGEADAGRVGFDHGEVGVTRLYRDRVGRCPEHEADVCEVCPGRTLAAELTRLRGEVERARATNRELNRRVQRAEHKLNRLRQVDGWGAGRWLVQQWQRAWSEQRRQLKAFAAAVGLEGPMAYVTMEQKVLAFIKEARERGVTTP